MKKGGDYETSFLSNLIKIKNTSIFRLIFIFPFICVILSLLFSSLGGKEVLSLTAETTVNQWGVIWINVIIAVNSALLNKLELDSNKYSVYLSRNVNLKGRIHKNYIGSFFKFNN